MRIRVLRTFIGCFCVLAASPAVARADNLTLGAYTILDAPDFKMAHGKLPVAPYANAYWTWR